MSQPRIPNGITLVEVALAIGIVTFSFLSVFALLPVGTQLFHQAMNTSVSVEFVRRIASDAEQTDFNTLIVNSVSGTYYALRMRYFDDQSSEVNVITSIAPSSSELAKIIYWVRVRSSLPGPPDPASASEACLTSLPSTGSERFNPRATTFLTIQIARNPAGIDLLCAFSWVGVAQRPGIC